MVAACLELLAGRAVDDQLVIVLGGPHADLVLNEFDHDYWLRTWALRALLYVWDDRAATAVSRATKDPVWRVREMALKVIARREIGDALAAVGECRLDSVPRVRAAAERALRRLSDTLA